MCAHEACFKVRRSAVFTITLLFFNNNMFYGITQHFETLPNLQVAKASQGVLCLQIKMHKNKLCTHSLNHHDNNNTLP